MRRLTLVCSIVIMALIGCTRENVSDVERDGDGGINVTITMTEDEVNTLITQVIAAGQNQLLRDPQVDLQPGQMVINGERDRLDGNGRVSGTLTVTLSVEEGALLVQVTASTFEDITVQDAVIQEFNERLRNRLQRRADPDNRAINYQTVMITADTIEFVLNARRMDAADS